VKALEREVRELGQANELLRKASATSRLPKPKVNFMLSRPTSICQHDSQPKASGRPGAVQMPLTI
jgi:hypothetical protein